MSIDFCLSERVDWDMIKRDFASRGRVEIPALLGGGQAEALHHMLAARSDWHLVMNAGDKVYEMTRGAAKTLTAAQRSELERLVTGAGRTGFQYRYESIRAPDGGNAASSDPVARFVAFLSSAPVMERLNHVLAGSADFADGQATSYGAGHFLTCHDDDVEGKKRQAAYVFSLTPQWRAEWGGLLMFHRSDGNIDEAFVPRFGALRLFAVPQRHSVSYVTPLAPFPRLSITGWLRQR